VTDTEIEIPDAASLVTAEQNGENPVDGAPEEQPEDADED
jgi:hypothetical protein